MKKYLDIIKFRLYPTKEEKALLDKELNFYKRYFNALKNEVETKKKETLFEPTREEISRICDDFRNKIRATGYDFSKYLYLNHFSNAKENVIRSYIYRKKKNIKKYQIDRVSIKINDPGCYVMYGKFFFKYNHKIKLRPQVEMLEGVSSLSITRTNGKYYLSVVRKLDCIDALKTNKACGIDVGFKDYMTIYDSTDHVETINFDNLKVNKLISKSAYYKKVLLNIEIKNKNYMTSNNYKKVLNKLERCYEKIKTIRAHFFNEIATRIVTNYDLITVEGLEFESLFRKRESKLNLSKNSFGSFFKVLEEKAYRYGKKVIRADRFFESSQICSECGLINHKMKDTSLREFSCECGFKAGRDENAAKNLMYYGIREIRKQNLNSVKKKEKERGETKSD